MTPDLIFSAANATALVGWLVLATGVIAKRPLLRDTVAGLVWPLGLSLLYSVLILFFFGSAEGGFDTLANVKQLFTSDWAALAGWVHYLAFDLLIGSWIARKVMEHGWPRALLIILLPLTFMFGPMGLAAFHIIQVALQRKAIPFSN